jgi:hypothetical protein
MSVGKNNVNVSQVKSQVLRSVRKELGNITFIIETNSPSYFHKLLYVHILFGGRVMVNLYLCTP